MEHLPGRLHRQVVQPSRGDHDAWPCARYNAPASPLEEIEAIRAALRAEDGNRTRAARRLGMSRSTLWTKLRYYSHQLDPGD